MQEILKLLEQARDLLAVKIEQGPIWCIEPEQLEAFRGITRTSVQISTHNVTLIRHLEEVARRTKAFQGEAGDVSHEE
jgi:hypothetical protein